MVYIKRDYPGDAERNAHVEFVARHWDSLAKAAYKFFLEKGRGIMLVSTSEIPIKPKGAVTQVQIGYLALSATNFGQLMADKNKETGWIREYEPAKTLLVAFLRSDDGMSSYKIDGIGSRRPKDLYDTG